MKELKDGVILLVNDTPDQLDLLDLELSRAGFLCLRAREGEEALEIARTKHPELIISDVVMPVMNGFELCRQIRADAELAMTPVLLISALHRNSQSAVEGLQTGADDYLEVPYDPLLLIAKATRLIERKRLDEQLRQSQQFLSMLLDNAPTPIYVQDRQHHLRLVNKEWERAMWLKRQVVIGKTIFDLFPPSVAAQFARNDQQVFGSETAHVFEEQLDDHYYHTVKFPLFNRAGEVDSLGGISVDITDRKQAEQALRESEGRLRKQNDVLVRLAKHSDSETTDLLTAIRGVTENAARTLAAARVSVWLYNAERTVIRCLDLYDLHADDHASGYELSKEKYPGYFRALEAETTIAADDARHDSRTQEFTVDYLTPHGITSMLDAPIRVGGQVVGVICHEHIGQSRQWMIDEQNFAGSMSDTISLLMETEERRRAEKELRYSQQKYAALVNTIDGVVWEVDARTMAFTFVSDQAEKLLGYPAEQWIKEPTFWQDHLHPDDAAWVIDSCRQATCEKREHQMEYRMVTRDERIVWVRDLVSVVVEGEEAVALRGILMDITTRKQAEDALRRSEERFRLVSRATNDLIYDWDIATYECQWNEALHTSFGYSESEVEKMFHWWSERIHPDDQERVHASLHGFLLEAGHTWSAEYRIRRGDGSYATVLDRGIVSRNERGEPLRLIGTIMDLTERRQAQEALLEKDEQLRQAQKMEAVGRLAGGVAHDFNNLLTAINGYADLSLRQLREDDPLHRNLLEIKKAGWRATDLTRQLLAFSRKQILQPKVLNINAAISDLTRMLQRIIGEDIDLQMNLASSLGQVKADPGQLEQIIVNLAVNSRDAMVDGGKLILETADINLDDDFARTHVGVDPGQYVMLAITDTGCGMDEQTTARIFEPFFTTKEVGKGTGLGLSTVYGIVQQSGGSIWVDSKVGRGTTFKIYLPAISEQPSAFPSASRSGEWRPGKETILLVEDDDSVRDIALITLRLSGYKVLEATHGGEALLVAGEYTGPIHLILTDMVMPRMNGRVLVDHLRKSRPDLKALYMSGYTEDSIFHRHAMEEGIDFLEKPLTPESLCRKVREVLDANPSTPLPDSSSVLEENRG